MTYILCMLVCSTAAFYQTSFNRHLYKSFFVPGQDLSAKHDRCQCYTKIHHPYWQHQNMCVSSDELANIRHVHVTWIYRLPVFSTSSTAGFWSFANPVPCEPWTFDSEQAKSCVRFPVNRRSKRSRSATWVRFWTTWNPCGQDVADFIYKNFRQIWRIRIILWAPAVDYLLEDFSGAFDGLNTL